MTQMTPILSRIRLAATLALVAWLAGCATSQSKPLPPPDRDWNRPDRALSYAGGRDGRELRGSGDREQSGGAEPEGINLDDEGEVIDEDEIREEVIQIGNRELFNRQAASRGLPVPPVDGEVTFNFQDQPIQAVVQAIIGVFMGENYIIGPGVGGTVTYVTQKPINASQAMGVLEYLLALNNASILFKDGRYEILPTASALPGNLSPRMGPIPTGRGYQVQIVPLTYISPTEMQRLLAPFARPNAVISADNSRSIIVLAGTREELQTYQRTIEIFDVDWLQGVSIAFYPLVNAEVSEVMTELTALFMEENGSPLAGMFRFLPVERLGGIFVITQNPGYLEEARKWLKRLDRSNASLAGTQLFVYNVRNVKAVDLADYLGAIFTGGGAPAGRSQRRAPRADVAPGAEAVEISSGQTQTQRRRQAGGGANTTGNDDISFTAVEENNQLLIRSTQAQYQAVMAAIRKLDIEPLQVHVEMQIIEVSLTDNFEFGVQWFLEGLLGQGLEPNPDVGWHQPGNQQRWSFGDGAASAITPGGNFFYRFTSNELDVAIKALQNEAEIRILSAPSLTVLNNQEAKINIGDQIPVVSTSFVGIGGIGGSNPVSTANVQFRDTGVILSVTPRVNPGGLVYLELSQEVSKRGERDTVSGNYAINKRTVETQVAVQSSETVLLGGFISEDNTNNERGVPGLSRIPILGRAFGHTARTKSRSELVVLITPRVIQTVMDARELTDEYQENFRNLRPLDLRTGQPFSGSAPVAMPEGANERDHEEHE